MADHMFLLNGSISGKRYQFESAGGPYVTNGQHWARVAVRRQPCTENIHCGHINVAYDEDGEPFATYARMLAIWERDEERREERRYG